MSEKIDKIAAAQLIVSTKQLTNTFRKNIEKLFLDNDTIPHKLVSRYNKSLLEHKQVLDKYNNLFGLVYWSSLRLLQNEMLDDAAKSKQENE